MRLFEQQCRSPGWSSRGLTPVYRYAAISTDTETSFSNVTIPTRLARLMDAKARSMPSPDADIFPFSSVDPDVSAIKVTSVLNSFVSAPPSGSVCTFLTSTT